MSSTYRRFICHTQTAKYGSFLIMPSTTFGYSIFFVISRFYFFASLSLVVYSTITVYLFCYLLLILMFKLNLDALITIGSVGNSFLLSM